jgi:SHS2 domain-containing protein
MNVPTRAPVEFQVLDHTGDVGILVRAPDICRLFETAAAAMFTLVADPRGVQTDETESVHLTALDRETLLVAWLSELLSRHATEGRLYALFEVTRLDETTLTARIGGEAIDPSRHCLETEIKAVTYHHLLVSEDAAGWSARVIFDV